MAKKYVEVKFEGTPTPWVVGNKFVSQLDFILAMSESPIMKEFSRTLREDIARIESANQGQSGHT